MPQILIVDDEAGIRDSLRGILEDEGYKASVSPSGEDCLELLRKSSFDLILLDPPTFSASRESGVFQAQKHYGRLMAATLPLLNPGGVIFASTNAAEWPAEKFLESLQNAVSATKQKIAQLHYVPQPPDFPISRQEPAYLKTFWLRLAPA